MPVFPTPDVIEIAKVCQYLAAQNIAKKAFYGGQIIDKRLPQMLYMERRALEFMYNNDPSDSGLDGATNYVYELCAPLQARARAIIAGPVCVPVFIIVQPVNETEPEGGTVTFSVIAGGTASLSYQWFKDATPLVGEVAATLLIDPVALADDGDYYVTVTNACGTVTSSTVTLTVSAALIQGFFWYGATDPYPDISVGVDNLSYQQTFNITDGASLTISPQSGAANNVFNVTKYPTTQSIKDTWFNTAFNNGTIPDSVYRAVLTIGSFYYIVARNAMSLDTSSTLVFSDAP